MPVLEFSWNFFPWHFPGILAFWRKFYFLFNILNTKNFQFPNPLNANYHPIIKKIMKIENCTSARYSSPRIQKTNQDYFFIEKDFLYSPKHFFLGVCDVLV